jgi:hypothetical protein
VKLFQIEEPDGGPADLTAPGAAIGVDASGAQIEVAFSVGGNALILHDREGFERAVPVPAMTADIAEWQLSFEAARIRAERALARPVTHAVVALAELPGAAAADRLHEAAALAGLIVLRFAGRADLAPGMSPAVACAGFAEDLAPRPGFPN